MGLQAYRKKRKFDVTPEPRGKAAARRKGNCFVIQKHAARRLHYDFRLELDGVMKSWAVTRGPSLFPGEKRLAVHTEDHPIEYNSFEGIIPQGEYGGGTVLIWDRGHWFPEGDVHKAYAKGHLDFSLQGKKLSGRWHLVRMARRQGESKEPWLLIKARDDAARESKGPDILEEEPLSVVSGRSIAEIAEGKGRKRVWHSNRSVQENVKAGATRGISAGRKGARPPSPTPPHKGEGSAPGKITARSKKSKAGNKTKTSRTKGEPLPDFVPPSLATLRAEAPGGDGWVHEIKFDGYRIHAHLEDGDVRLLTRKGLDWTEKFRNVAAAVKKLRAKRALIDGEIIVADARGVSSFSGLQAALKADEQDSFIYYVFDLLHRDGRTLAGLPLIERKAELAELVGHEQTGVIRYSEHFDEAGKTVLRHACDMGLEGIVSKRADAPYRSGRIDTFIKTKCANEQEFVVGGYSHSTAMPDAVGALVVGYYEGDRLVYAGRIGTGYTHMVARDLWKRLSALEVASTPFDVIPRAQARRRDVRWVEPAMVIESHFRGWTADNLVRQAAFKGVREDKPAHEVVRETSADSAADIPPPARGRSASEASRVGVESVASNSDPHPNAVAARRHSTSPLQGEASSSLLPDSRMPSAPVKGATAKVGWSPKSKARPPSRASPRAAAATAVRFTNPDRVYWADVGVTKQELADYYRLAWQWMAPHMVDRPLALVRCPDGTKGECFFQKHASAGLNEKYLKTVIDKNRRQIIAVEDLEGLLSLVQAGVLEVHVRGSRIDRLDLCDRIVFDLDPGPGVTWAQVVAAARDVRERLAGINLVSFVKLTGGKGLHVVLPIAGIDWKSAKDFAQAVAAAMMADAPDLFVVKITKSLRDGKILVDYFRNSLEQTSVAAYSTRARDGAPVAAPVAWEELSRTKAGNQYTVRNLGKRLAGLRADPWADLPRTKQKLPDLRSLRGR